MKYLIFTPLTGDSFFTDCFASESHYVEGDIVFDLHRFEFTSDGKTWKPIRFDTL